MNYAESPSAPSKKIIHYVNPSRGGKRGEQASTADTSDSRDDCHTAFPTDLLPTSLRDIVVETARLYQLPEELPGVLVLGAVSVALGQGIVLRNPPHETAGNLFVLVSAPSGTGKSNAFRFVMKPLYDAETERVREFNEKRRPGLEAEKAILEAKMIAEKKAVIKPHGKLSANHEDAAKNRLRDLKVKLEEVEALLQPPRLIVEDATVQKMALLMSHSSEAIALLSPDAGDVISNILGRWNNAERTDENLLLKAFSRDSYTQDRIGRGPVALTRPCAAVVLVVTPDALEDLFSVERLSNGGLLPRFLVLPSFARPMPSNGPLIPDEKIAGAWRDCLNRLLAAYRWLSGASVEVSLAPGAAAVFDEYRNTDFVARFDELADIASFVARYAEQAKRLALVLHVGKYGTDASAHPLAEETAKAGVEFTRFFAARQLTFMERSRVKRRSEEARKIYDLVAPRPMTLRDLKRRHGYDQKHVETLAAEFPNLLLIETVKPAGPGHPSKIIRTTANP